MTVSRINCDKCSQEIMSDRTLIHVQTGPLRAWHPAIDLCADCAANLARWLKEGPDAEGSPAKLPPPSPRPSPVHRPHTRHALGAPVLV